MDRCVACRDQLLEHLYGLLDGAEREAVELHLAGCDGCRAALDAARRQQALLARAARTEFPAVRFEPPAETPAPATLTLAPPPGRAPRPQPRRWAVAAAVLLAAAGLGAPAAYFGADYRATRHAVAAHQAALNELRSQAEGVDTRLAALRREHPRRVEAVQAKARARAFDLQVTGPAALRAGAPTEFRVETRDPAGRPVPAEVAGSLVDAAGNKHGPFPAAPAGEGVFKFTVPPDAAGAGPGPVSLLVDARRDGAAAELSEALPLTAPVYLTHLTTDKPMYQPGEVVRYRSLMLDRSTLRPPGADWPLTYTLTTPRGEQRVLLNNAAGLFRQGGPAVAGPDGKPLRGVGAGEYALPPESDGGEWILTARDPQGRVPEQRRKFLVNRYQRPPLDKELDFGRTAYGPGDEVTAVCKARRAGGGAPVANAPVEVTVNVDGATFGPDGRVAGEPIRFRTDADGRVVVRFRLPGVITWGKAGVAVTFHDGGTVDTLVRPVPLVLKRLQVEFFPEGGDLVAGLPNVVYFEARTPLDRPADLEGVLLEDGKPTAVEAATARDAAEPGVNHGMGKFAFTPRAGHAYALRVESPAGVEQQFPLPAVKPDGVVLSVPDGVTGPGMPIRVALHASPGRGLMVGAYCRGRLLDSVRVPAGQTEAVLHPTSGVGGVCRVTAFEERPAAGGGGRREYRPVAERLVYRRPAEELKLTLKPDRTSYVPGQRVTLGVEAKDEQGRPAPAVALLAAVDQGIVTLADDKTARSMPTHFLLTTEVRRAEDLEYADFLLKPGPKSEAALDLLLGTQGWRRFAEQNPEKFREERRAEPAEAERFLVSIGHTAPVTADLTRNELLAAEREYAAELSALNGEAFGARTRLQEAVSDPAVAAAAGRLAWYNQALEEARAAAPQVLSPVLAVLALVLLTVGLSRRLGRALPYYGAAGACAALLAAVVVFAGRAPVGQPAGDGPQLVRATDQAAPPQAGAAVPKDAAKEGKEAAPMALPRPGVPLAPARGALQPPAPAAVEDAAVTPQGLGGGAPKAMMAQPAARMMAPQAAGDVGQDKQAVELRMLKEKADGAVPEGLQHAKGAGLPGKPGFGAGLSRKLEAERPAADRPAPEGAAGPAAPAAAQDARGRAFGRLEPANGVEAQFAGRRMDAKRMSIARSEVAPVTPMFVREYAHQRPPGATPELRADFAETLLWQPAAVLSGGKAEAAFDLCDSVTTFQVTAYAHTLDGRIGAATATIESRLPLSLRPRTPLEVTAGDRVEIPLAVSNNTGEGRTVDLRLTEHAGLVLDGTPAEARVDVAGPAPVRKVFRFRPEVQQGEAALTFTARAPGFAADTVRAAFRVVPDGFPVDGARSDLLEGSASADVVLPNEWVRGTLRCNVQVYPSTLADLQQGLEALLREPGGCFEQTSTNNYPNLLILDYLRESDQARPEAERRARELLARGYAKLTSFECSDPAAAGKRHGYEWFGGAAPPHEALTAYGLMQFRDMARVSEVDAAMVQRTRDYLLSRRDGKGGFQRNPRALDTFGRAPDDVTNAYIVWSLTEAGKDDDVTKELDALAAQAKGSKDPYFLALVANSLVNRARTAEGVALLKAAAAAQKDDGRLDAERTSITGSGGRDLQIETTALAVLGWLKADPGGFNAPVRRAVAWIGKQRGGYGGFGSTQSTILALKALTAYAKLNKRTLRDGELQLFVGGRPVAKKTFAAGAAETLVLELPDAEADLRPGKNDVRVALTGQTGPFPYTLAWSYRTRQPASAEGCPVRVETKLAKAEVREGESVRLTVRVENATGQGQGMAVAVVGLPGGLTVPEDLKQLKEYARLPADGSRPLVSAFELRGRELVLYWRDLAPNQKIEVPVDLVARVPGAYSGPASRAYLYYNADRKHWVEPLRVTVAAKAEE